MVEFSHVTFSYPLSDRKALDDVSFSIDPSEFIVLCGKSGCGKSTLLKHLKKTQIPYGVFEGSVTYCGEEVAELEQRKSVAEIGFVQQNPDHQIVTDKVWHELAFGLESLGLDRMTIRRRVAEMASYFDIQTWFRKDVSALSGGQKQLLNLASIMAMQPTLLVLDEPTSQLDPIAASDFLRTLQKINRDFGTTILLSEHRLEEAFSMADRVMVMDQGKIFAYDKPRRIAHLLAGGSESQSTEDDDLMCESESQSTEDAHLMCESESQTAHYDMLPGDTGRHPMFYGLPAVMKIHQEAGGEDESPLTIREGRLWLGSKMAGKNLEAGLVASGAPEGKVHLGDGQFGTSSAGRPDEVRSRLNGSKKNGLIQKAAGMNQKDQGFRLKGRKKSAEEAQAILTLREVWFRYEKNLPDVLQDCSIRVPKGSLYCVLGGNGVGKSTALKVIAGVLKPQRGKVSVEGRMALLPQNPQALFTEITVEDELLEALYYEEKSDEEKVRLVLDMMKRLEMEHLRKAHPYDLSGGEQQRLALGKVLLLDPDLLLLDEPTKGLDPFFKIRLAQILKELTQAGKTLFMVSHDIEFCAEYADRCAMFFDGGIISDGTPREFFSGNSFYTTAANKMARDYFPEAITWREVVEDIRKV